MTVQRERTLEALQAAVQEGLADSTAGTYTDFKSPESLTAHLKSLAAKAKDQAMTSAKHYKCGACGWVHFELSLKDAQAHTDAVNAAMRADDKPVAVERYFACARCGASRATFVPALPGDAPPLSNLRGIVLLSNKERKNDRF